MSFVACTGAVTRPVLAHAFLVSVHSIESIDLQGGMRSDAIRVSRECCPFAAQLNIFGAGKGNRKC
jgi:hypothetical protein